MITMIYGNFEFLDVSFLFCIVSDNNIWTSDGDVISIMLPLGLIVNFDGWCAGWTSCQGLGPRCRLVKGPIIWGPSPVLLPYLLSKLPLLQYLLCRSLGGHPPPPGGPVVDPPPLLVPDVPLAVSPPVLRGHILIIVGAEGAGYSIIL